MLQNIAATPDKNNRHRQSPTPHVRPFRIAWHGKTYDMTNITNYHTAKENGIQVHVFSATDGSGTFELKFDNKDMEWFLGV